jgi:hypothetical protein
MEVKKKVVNLECPVCGKFHRDAVTIDKQPGMLVQSTCPEVKCKCMLAVVVTAGGVKQ